MNTLSFSAHTDEPLEFWLAFSAALAAASDAHQVGRLVQDAARDLLAAPTIDLRLLVNGQLAETPYVDPLVIPTYRRQVLEESRAIALPDLLALPDLPAPLRDMARVHDLRACLVVPVRAAGAMVGVLACYRHVAQPWTGHEQRRAAALAGQVALAVTAFAPEAAHENTRLLHETHQRAEQLAAVHAVAHTAGQSLDVQSVLDAALAKALEVVGVSAGAISLVDEAAQELVVRAHRGWRHSALPSHMRIPLGQGLSSAALLGDNVIVTGDVSADQRVAVPAFRYEGIHAMALAPMHARGKAIGVLGAMSYEPHEFSPQAIVVLQAIADEIGLAVDNARLYEDERRRREQIERIQATLSMLGRDLGLDALLKRVVNEAARIFNAEAAAVFMWDDAHEHLTIHASLGLSPAYVNSQRLPRARVLTAIPTAGRFDSLIIPDLRARPFGDPALINSEQLISAMATPMPAGSELLGTLVLYSRHAPRAFTPEEADLCTIFARYAAVAIENTQLFDQARRHADELALLQVITLQLSATLDLATVLDTIATSTLRLIAADLLYIFLYETERDALTFGAGFNRLGTRVGLPPAPPDGSVITTVVREQRAVVLPDTVTAPPAAHPEWLGRAGAGLPLLRAGQTLGMMWAGYAGPHVMTQDELRILGMLGDHAAIAVENAHLYADVQRRLDEVSTLYTLSRQMTSSLELDTVLGVLVNTLRQVLNCRACSIALLEPVSQVLDIRAAAGVAEHWMRSARLAVGEGIAGRVAQSGQQIYVPDTTADPHYVFFDPTVRSLLCVPLMVKDQVIGTLSVDSDQPDAFGGLDERMLTIAAAQAAVAIENAQLYRDLKARAESLQRAYDEVAEANRLKDELVQNVSHELRTPLTYVKSYVAMLVNGELGPITQDQSDSLHIVAQKADTLARLVSDIVTLQHVETGNLRLEALDMAELAHLAVTGAAPAAAERQLTLETEAPPDLPPAHGDRDRINQVFDNLLGNAIKFSPNGGHILVSLAHAADGIQVAVHDNGIGIPADQLDKIWQRFYQVDGSPTRRYGGTGLGLAIVQRIVQAHHGRVWASSTLGEGSTFYFSIPLAPVTT